MSVLRFFAVVLIFAAITAAWMCLGATVWVRTEMQDSSASKEIESLWGPKLLKQTAPYWARQPSAGRADAGAVAPAASTVTANVRHEYRYKGLLWYSLFRVEFSGTYTVPAAEAGRAGETAGVFIFRAPEGINLLDGLTVAVDGEPVEVPQDQKAAGRLMIPVDRQVEHVVTVALTTQGQEAWLYFPGEVSKHDTWDHDHGGEVVSANGAMSELKDFSLTVTTNFTDIDYPKGSRSPKDKATPVDGGMKAVWQYENSLTRQPMGMAMPDRIDPGPIVQRMSFFAPVSLFFFFTTLFTVIVLKKIPLHPMHYLFISAAFFAFHSLLAYLVDHVPLHAAFWICAAVSVVLVVSYMRLVAGARFAMSYVAAAQLIYLIGFSYAFFWKGYTGLTVVIGAILTLFVLMMATGRVNWHAAFSRSKPQPPEPPAPPVSPGSTSQA